MRQGKLRLHKEGISILSVFVSVLFFSCAQDPSLPIYGHRDISESGDTIYHAVGDFSFINQFGDTLTEDQYQGKVYVVDFVFTTCQGICPVMTNELHRVQEHFKSSGDTLLILSHTVDPERDSAEQLKMYGEKKGANFSTWQFVTGSRRKLYKMAKEYLVISPKPDEKIDFVHSDKFVLVDRKGQIRGIYNGTETADVDRLIVDAELLLKEK